jgi:hypothetical protein
MTQIHWVGQNLLQKMSDIPNFVIFFLFPMQVSQPIQKVQLSWTKPSPKDLSQMIYQLRYNTIRNLQNEMSLVPSEVNAIDLGIPSSWTDAWSSMHRRLDEKLDNQIDSSSHQDFTGHNEGIKMNRTWKNRVWHITIYACNNDCVEKNISKQPKREQLIQEVMIPEWKGVGNKRINRRREGQ